MSDHNYAIVHQGKSLKYTILTQFKKMVRSFPSDHMLTVIDPESGDVQ